MGHNGLLFEEGPSPFRLADILSFCSFCGVAKYSVSATHAFTYVERIDINIAYSSKWPLQIYRKFKH